MKITVPIDVVKTVKRHSRERFKEFLKRGGVHTSEKGEKGYKRHTKHKGKLKTD